jgi:hypothetical protein
VTTDAPFDGVNLANGPTRDLQPLHSTLDRATLFREDFQPLGAAPASEPEWWQTSDAIVGLTRVGRWDPAGAIRSWFTNARRLEWVTAS